MNKNTRDNLNNAIKTAYEEWEPSTKTEEHIGVHGSSKGDIVSVEVYYDVYYQCWTPSKSAAFKGYLMQNAGEFIREVVKE